MARSRAVLSLVLLFSASCGDDATLTGDTDTSESGSSEADSGTTSEDSDETGAEEFPDCVPADDPPASGYTWPRSDSWGEVAVSQGQFVLERALCSVTSVEHDPELGESGSVFLRSSCVRELDQVVYDDFVLMVSDEALGSQLATLLGSDEFELRFEQANWFNHHLQHAPVSVRNLDGELLFVSANGSYAVTGVDQRVVPRWQLDPVGAPAAEPDAIAGWFAPFAGIALVDDVCPIVDESLQDFHFFDKSRRFAIRVEDDMGEHLMLDGTAHELLIDGQMFEARVTRASSYWYDGEEALAGAEVSVVMIRTDLP